MKRLLAVVCAAALVVCAVNVMAQATPSFAGKWTLVPDPNAAPPAGGGGGGGGRGRGGFGGLGNEFTATQDAKTLTIVSAGPAGEVKRVYNLDGTESKNTMTFGQNSIDQVSKAKWDANKLVITTTSNFGGTPTETTMTLSLDATGNLVVDSTGGRGGPTKMTYKKS